MQRCALIFQAQSSVLTVFKSANHTVFLLCFRTFFLCSKCGQDDSNFMRNKIAYAIENCLFFRISYLISHENGLLRTKIWTQKYECILLEREIEFITAYSRHPSRIVPVITFWDNLFPFRFPEVNFLHLKYKWGLNKNKMFHELTNFENKTDCYLTHRMTPK